jgi:predicted site-specific integrase-resolvase
MPKPKKTVAGPRPIAAYVRVSSKDQKTDSQRDVIAQ